MRKICKSLNISFPFIVENGACIFFPKIILIINKLKKKFIEYGDYVGLPIGNNNLKEIKDYIKINFKQNFKFSFLSELKDEKVAQLTNLKTKEAAESKNRQFSDPIYWNDTIKNLIIFKKKLKENEISVSEGGRFVHFNVDYDKGKAVDIFLEIYRRQKSQSLFTISLGDSENDLSMLELTKYSCFIKSQKKKIFI